jgi:tetratricopeptide (TPR) repeat protein
MKTLWDGGAYQEAFDVSGETLKSTPLDYNALVLRGFSAYQLALAQTTTADKLLYVDESIQNLRKALIIKSGVMDGPIQYVLGKAYYNKGYDYADLAVKFLEAAQQTPFAIEDMPECLGLAYAALHDYRNSVSAFSLALNGTKTEQPSDPLLLAIAHSYTELGDFDMAAAYATRCVETSKDYKAVTQARLLLGSTFIKQGETGAAREQYLAIIRDMGENAEARYQLGELYAATNDQTRARAEWRTAIRIDPAHAEARARLSLR